MQILGKGYFANTENTRTGNIEMKARGLLEIEGKRLNW